MTLFRTFGLASSLLIMGCSSDDDGATGTTRVEYVVRDGLPTNSILSAVVIDANGTPVAAINDATYHYDFTAKAWTKEGPNNANGLRRDAKGNLLGWYGETTSNGERVKTTLNIRKSGAWSTLPALPGSKVDVSDVASDGDHIFVLTIDFDNGPAKRGLLQLDPGSTTWRSSFVPSVRSDGEHILRADRAGQGAWVMVTGEAVYRRSTTSDSFEKVAALDIEPYGNIGSYDTAPGGGAYFVAPKQLFRIAPGGTAFEKVDGPPAHPDVNPAVGSIGTAAFDDRGNFTSALGHGNDVYPPLATLYRKAGGTGPWKYVAEFSSMSTQPVYAPDGRVFLVSNIQQGTWTLARQL